MTFASIYIKPDKLEGIKPNIEAATTIQGQLKQSFNQAKNNIENFDLKTFSQNLTIEGVTDFTQKYATAGLSAVINGEPITSSTILEGLFNGYAPALDQTAIQMGYNNVLQMKNAVSSGNINVTNFFNGFSGALSTVINDEKNAVNYDDLGDEITIDMVIELDQQMIAETPDRRVESGQVYNDYIHVLPDIKSFVAKIKNDLRYSVQEYREILEETFKSKKPFTFRAGDEVYENYVFTSCIPSRNFEESLNFTAEIKKIEVGEISVEKVNIPKSSAGESVAVKKNTTSKVGNAGDKIKNNTAPKKIYGIGRIINIDKGVDNIIKKLESWK